MLQDIIRQHIQQNGFITIADYMQLCLLHPEHGYYTTCEPFGVEGDFTTAPEISQLFGEILGIWAVLEWQQLGSPHEFSLVELGPGRGTLMRDLLRGVSHVTDFITAVRIHMIEASPQLQGRQREMLSDSNAQVTWHETIDALSFDKPMIVIANEFFDAMPIRQFIKKNDTWQENVIVIENDQFAWSARPVFDDLPDLPDNATVADGAIVEVFTQSETLFDQLCVNLKLSLGSMVIIDYGDHVTPRIGDTLQALKKHQRVDVLQAWDHADLTAHVDFYRLEQIARQYDLQTDVTSQREFLKSCGIDIRLQKLTAQANEAKIAELQSGYYRLIDPNQMGHLFKVLKVRT